MLRRHAQLRTLLTVVVDILTTTTALVLAYVIRLSSGLFPAEKWDALTYLGALPPSLLLSIATYSFVGNYRRSGVQNSGRAAAGGVLAATLLLAAGALFYRNEYQFSRGLLVVFPVVGFPLVWAGRQGADAFLRALHRRGVGVRSALLVGSGEAGGTLAGVLERELWLGIRIAATLTDPHGMGDAIRIHGIGQVFVSWPGDRFGELEKTLELLRDEAVDVRVLPDLGRAATLNPEVTMLEGLPLITLRQTPIHGINRYAKRTYDLLVGSVLSVFLLPVALVTALVVLIGSGRPVLYAQERMGLDGRRFRILKFRTMRIDAESGSDAVWSTENDPRTTGPGRFLRRFSLDEVPQLLNVLKGEMSLVGPRPERPVFIEEFRRRLPGYMHRLRIPAGLTGLAQVRGFKGDTDLNERLRLDLRYLEDWSLVYDTEILILTAARVLFGK